MVSTSMVTQRKAVEATALQDICPNLIAPDLVIVKPMASISGFITYKQNVA